MLFDSGLRRTPAKALTHDELLAKLEAAGYSQVRENGSGKIKTFKAVKNGKDVSVIVDSFGETTMVASCSRRSKNQYGGRAVLAALLLHQDDGGFGVLRP